ncbi:MAG: hypothetical protein JWM93_2258 [Frankiales bacterium]|nr:hypothetical protein [Frankiales bacterium]
MASITKITRGDGTPAWRVRYRDENAKSREKWFPRQGEDGVQTHAVGGVSRPGSISPSSDRRGLSSWHGVRGPRQARSLTVWLPTAALAHDLFAVVSTTPSRSKHLMRATVML